MGKLKKNISNPWAANLYVFMCMRLAWREHRVGKANTLVIFRYSAVRPQVHEPCLAPRTPVKGLTVSVIGRAKLRGTQAAYACIVESME